MYIVIKKEGNLIKFVCVRGTSQLEGYHKHLAALLVGTNYSALLAGALIIMRNYRWVASWQLQCLVTCSCLARRPSHGRGLEGEGPGRGV